MVSITAKDVNAHELIKAFAAHLKKQGKLEVPKWVDIVKTATYKELAPYDSDWYYVRCASIARHIYLRPNVGVGALRKVHGGRKRRGTRPSHHAKGSGSIDRKALQSLEKIGLIEKTVEGKGRHITSTGQRELDQISAQVIRARSE